MRKGTCPHCVEKKTLMELYKSHFAFVHQSDGKHETQQNKLSFPDSHICQNWTPKVKSLDFIPKRQILEKVIKFKKLKTVIFFPG